MRRISVLIRAGRPSGIALLAGSAMLSGAVLAAPPTYQDLAPVFAEHCVLCHNGPGAPLGLELDSYAGIMAGSQRGPVVRSGDAGGSELIRRLRGESQPRMPLTGPPFVPDETVARIAEWIEAGAPEGAGQATAPVAAPPRLPAAGEPVDYSHVAPILAQRCAKCHSDNGIMGAPPEGLRLTSLAQVLAGGERAIVVPGAPGASDLVRRIRGQSRPRMPFDGPPFLSEDEIRVISDWVAQGARDADGKAAPVPVGARVRFEGRLTGSWAVDGQPIVVSGGTRIRKSPRIGDHVEVRGSVGADGRIHASRIRRR